MAPSHNHPLGHTHLLPQHALPDVLRRREQYPDLRERQLRPPRLGLVQPRLRGLAACGTVELVQPRGAVRADRRALALQHELLVLILRRRGAHVDEGLHQARVAREDDLRPALVLAGDGRDEARLHAREVPLGPELL